MTSRQEKNIAFLKFDKTSKERELWSLQREIPLAEKRLEAMRARVQVLPDEIVKAEERIEETLEQYAEENAEKKEAADKRGIENQIKRLQRELAKLEAAG